MNTIYTDAQKSDHVSTVQRYLRRVQQAEGHPRPLVPDGIYGPETRQAVREFQQKNGLPVTGTVDAATWEVLTRAYAIASYYDDLPAALYLFPTEPNAVIGPGSSGAAVYLIQIMLLLLSRHFSNIVPVAINGNYDTQTAGAVTVVQTALTLPQTGVVDRATWNGLVSLHNRYVYRDPLAWRLAERKA